MKIHANRLLDLLQPQGFQLSWDKKSFHSIGYIRLDQRPGIYQGIMVNGQGKRGEAVYPYIFLSLLRGEPYTKRLNEVKFIDDIKVNWNADRSWSIIKTDHDAVMWESELAKRALDLLNDFSYERGDIFVKQNEEYMDIVTKYEGKLVGLESLEGDQVVGFGDDCSDLRKIANEIAESLQIPCLPGEMGQRARRLAFFTLLHFSGEVENDASIYSGKHPLSDDRLLIVGTLLAERIYYRFLH